MIDAAEIIQFHINMLNDQARTSSYLASIREVVRRGDTVVDIGTGTGVYAVAAAQAGARHVYAIEAGRIAGAARRLFEANGLADRITLIRGLSTRIWLPERADVLISEVIGDEPLGEQVIRITQDALRRLLKPGARLIPSGVKIFALPVTIPDAELGKLTFTPGTLQKWRSWYDIEFAPLAQMAENLPFKSRFKYFINPYLMRDWKTLSAPVLLAEIDFRTWRRPWIRTTKTVTATAAGQLNGVLVYFDLQVGATTFLSTHPGVVDETNHWHSPLRVFAEPIVLRSRERFELTYWYRSGAGISGCEVR
jgi:type I protein arginine methyltransferase